MPMIGKTEFLICCLWLVIGPKCVDLHPHYQKEAQLYKRFRHETTTDFPEFAYETVPEADPSDEEDEQEMYFLDERRRTKFDTKRQDNHKHVHKCHNDVHASTNTRELILRIKIEVPTQQHTHQCNNQPSKQISALDTSRQTADRNSPLKQISPLDTSRHPDDRNHFFWSFAYKNKFELPRPTYIISKAETSAPETTEPETTEPETTTTAPTTTPTPITTTMAPLLTGCLESCP